MVRKLKVKIQGLTSYLQHRKPYGEDDKRMKEVTAILQKNSDDEEAYKEEVEISTYKDKDGTYYIPSFHIENSMIKAGTRERVQGQGKKTYKDYMKAFIIVNPEKIPIDPQEYNIRRDWVRIQRNRILRSRPEFPKGWTAEFTIIILEDTIPIKIVQKILDHAGGYIGIGDWRPKFGRFEVIEFKEIKEKK